MDPELLALLKRQIEGHYELRSLVENARRRGTNPATIATALREEGFGSLEELDRRIDALSRTASGAIATERMGALTAGAIGAQQGLTFGFGDEIGGPFASGREVGAARRAHPVAAGAGELAGALAPGLLTGTGLASVARAAPSLLGRMATGAAVGGAEGVLGAMGRGEGTARERLLTRETAMGGALGGALGFSLPVGGAMAAPITSRVPVPRETAARSIMEGIPDATMGAAPAELTALQSAIGPAGAGPVVAADTRAGQALAEGLAFADPAGAGQTLGGLRSRLAGAGQSLDETIARAAGTGERLSVAEMEAAQRAARSASGRAAFRPLEEMRPLDPERGARATALLQSLIDSPDVERIWQNAQRNATNHGYRLRPVIGRGANGRFAVTGAEPDFLTLQSITEALGDIVSTGFTSGSSAAARGTARALQGRLQAMREGMADIFGDQYANAQATWRAATRRVEAPRLAQRLFAPGSRVDVRDVRSWLASSPEAADVYRRAAIDDLRLRVLSSTNPVRYLSEMPRAKLELVFAPEQLTQIDNALNTWRRMRETTGLLAGSRTEARKQLVAAMGLSASPQPQRTLTGSLWQLFQPQGLPASRIGGAREVANRLLEPTIDPLQALRRAGPSVAPRGLLQSPLNAGAARTMFPPPDDTTRGY